MFTRWTPLLLLGVVHAQPAPSPNPGEGEAPSLKVVVTPKEQPAVVLTPEADAQRQQAHLEKAKKLRRQGNKLYSQGRYKEAIGKYNESLKFHVDIDVFYSIGVSHQQLEDWNKCIGFMDKYLQKASDPAKRGRANNTRMNCKSRIEADQELSISSTPSPAKVYLDDRRAGVVGMTPFKIKLKSGQHKVWVEADGYEPYYQNIIVSKKAPFLMKVSLKPSKKSGFIYVDCNIKEASIFINGQNIGLTPMTSPVKYPEGSYQVHVKREGYSSFKKSVKVAKGNIKVVNAHIMPLLTPSTWRSPVGWTFLVTGLILGGAGATASVMLANEEYNDTDEFDKYAKYEKMSYWIGGGVAALSLSLIIWDAARSDIPEADINPNYKKPLKLPGSESALSVHPLGFTLTF